jgi:hypothetical protein
MRARSVATIVSLVGFSGSLLVSCSGTANNPVAPGSISADQPADAAISNYLYLQSSYIEEVGRNSAGQWLYKATTVVRNQTARGVTVTIYRIQITAGATVGKSTAPYVWIPAYSSQNLALTLASGTRLQMGTLTWSVTIGYKDKYGNAGSVSGEFSDNPCYGCWDYSVAHVTP